jgi:hypothetical protein
MLTWGHWSWSCRSCCCQCWCWGLKAPSFTRDAFFMGLINGRAALEEDTVRRFWLKSEPLTVKVWATKLKTLCRCGCRGDTFNSAHAQALHKADWFILCALSLAGQAIKAFGVQCLTVFKECTVVAVREECQPLAIRVRLANLEASEFITCRFSSEPNVLNFIWLLFTNNPKKLKFLSLARLSKLV